MNTASSPFALQELFSHFHGLRRYARRWMTALAALALAGSPLCAGTPSIANLGNTTYVEQQGSPLAVAPSVTLTNGSSYADSYLQFSITSATATETLALQTVGSPDTTLGVVSVVGSTIYLGQGGTAKPIGSVDASLNGQAGTALRLNFSSLLANGGFENGTTSWTTNNALVTLGALATETFQERAPNGTPTFSTTIETASGRGNVLRMQSNGNVVGPSYSAPYGSMFGPEAWSSPFDAYAGDSLAVDWSAQNGSDHYEVYGFLVNTSDNSHTLLFHGRGATQAWTTTNGTIPADGNYRFRFVSGSYDATGGLALGASLYIDNIRVFGADGNDTAATSLARLVTYANSSNNPASSRNLDFLARAADGNQTTASSTITITLVDDAPSITTSGGSAAFTDGGPAVFLDAGVTISDPDGGSIDGATVAISTGLDASQDQLLFTNQNGISGSYSSTTGILTLTGSATPADYQTALRSVRYENTSTDPNETPRTITFSLGGNSLYFADTGHFYEFVSATGIAWTTARTRAETRASYGSAGYPKGVYGLQGYLVTVTSAAENAFVSSKLAGQGWMGATDETQESIWRWVTGPEGLEDGGQGRHFFTQTGAASGSPNLVSVYGGQTPGGGAVVGGYYHNWADGEPNDYPASGEDYAHFLLNGQWNDYPVSLGGIAGYVVEYGGIPGDQTLQTTASRGLTVTAVDEPPTDIALSSSTATHSAGVNATVGTLSSTDSDSASFTYTLVAGAGSTDNASFNISGSSLRANDPTALAPGAHSVRIRTTDATGESYEEAFAITVVDDVAPTVPTTPDLATGDDTGSSATDNTTSVTTPTFTGTAESGSLVRLYRAGGVQIGSATATGGLWSITSSALAEGTHAITATATDASGNISGASAALSVTMDTTAPSVDSITRHSPSSAGTRLSSVVYRVTFDEAVLGVDLADFRVVANNTIAATIDSIQAVSGSVYDVTLSPVAGEGDFRLDLAVSGTGITDPAGNTISGGFSASEAYTRDVTGPAILGPLEFEARTGTVGQGAGQFFQPYGTAVDRSGFIYVADTYNHRVQKLAPDRSFVLEFGSAGSAPGQLNAPYGVAVDRDGSVYVADSANHRIQKFTADGDFVSAFGAQGSADGEFLQPRGVAVDAAGFIYVADYGNHRIQKFDASGAFVGTWGGLGVADGQLNQPLALALDGLGHVFVVDTGNNRVQKFDTSGAFLARWGGFGAGNGQFNLPGGIAVDGGGNVHVADTRNNRLQRFDNAGAWLSRYGSFGAADGQFYYPAGLAIDSRGRVHVADTLNNRIQILRPDPAIWDVPADGRYRAGQHLDFVVQFSDDVVVGGAPYIEVTLTSGVVQAAYHPAGSAGPLVSFRYTIQSGDTDEDGVTPATSITLGGGWISDAAGNDADLGFTVPGLTGVKVDTTAPDAPSRPDLATANDSGASATDDITSVTTPVFTGTAEIGSTVELYADATLIGTVVASSGTWTITSAALADGTYAITAVATDVVGNTGAPSTALSLTIDTTAPGAPAAIALTAGTDTGVSSSDGFTGATGLVLTGSAEPGSLVTVSRSGAGVVGAIVADGSGDWTFDYTGTSLADGSHVFSAIATDAAGNTGAVSATFTAVVDTVAPDVPLLAGVSTDTGVSSSDRITADTTLVIQGTAEPDSTVALHRSGAGAIGTTQADGSGQWTFDSTGTTLADGAHGFSATATDLAGNTSDASSSLLVTIDTTAPAVDAIARELPVAALTNADTVVFSVAFTEAVTGVTVSDFVLAANGSATGVIGGVDAVDAGTYSVAVTSVAGNGDLRLDLAASGTGIADLAGNAIAGGFTTGETYAIDTVGPVILGPLEYAGQWGSLGVGSGAFFQPFGIALDRAGHVYVADTFNHRVQKFAADGTFIAAFGSQGGGDGQFRYPMGIAVDSAGHVWVTDSNNHRVQKFGPDGTYLAQFGTAGSGAGQFNQPQGIAIDSGGQLYVVDLGNNRVQKFTAAGAFVTAWGTLGTGDGQLYQPHGIAVDGDGFVYVADTNNNRVEKFTSAGVYVAQWGTFGGDEGEFNTLWGIAVDEALNVYVTDLTNNRVQKFDSSGTFLTAWGEFGIDDGEFYYPAALAVDPQGRVFVADTFNHRIQVFEPQPALAEAPADGHYMAGDALDFSLEYSSPVIVSGTPRLALDIGGVSVHATYHGPGATGAVVVFRYVVQPGDNDVDGIAILSTAIDLDGGAIRDLAGNDGTLAFTAPALPDVFIDTVAPVTPAIAGISDDDGVSATDGFTTDRTLVFSGTAEAGSIVSITRSGVGVVGTATANGSGVWTFDATGTSLPDGVHTFTVTATDAAGNVSAISAAVVVTVLDVPAVTSASTADATNGGAFTFAVTSSQPVSSYSATGLPAGLSIDPVTGVISGTPAQAGVFVVTVTAVNAIGSTDSVFTLTIAKAEQSITFGSLADRTYGDASVALSASASSGLPVTFGIVSGPATLAGSQLSITGAGTVVVRATQPGDGNFHAADPVDRSFVVSKAVASVTLGDLVRTYTGAPLTVSATTVPAGLPLAVTYDGSSSVPSAVGNYTVVATIVDADHQGSASGTLVISKIAQTITFAPIADRTTQPASFALSATASSGLPVAFAVTSGPATVSGSTLTLTGLPGTVVVTATQAGDAIHAQAASVERSFSVAVHGAATFFGALMDDGVEVGEFAAYLDESGQSGYMLGYLPGTDTGFVIEFSVDSSGQFTATTTLLPGGTSTITLAGDASVFAIAGTIAEFGLTFSATADPVPGSSSGQAGFYTASTLDADGGPVYTLTGNDGTVFVLGVIGGQVEGGTGSFDGDTGGFSVVGLGGSGTFSGAVGGGGSAVSGTFGGGAGDPVGFAGLGSSTSRTDRLVNLSSRGRVGTEDGVIVMGFVVSGSQPKPVLVRGVGPGLARFGVAEWLPNPRLSIFRDGAPIAENDDWGSASNIDDVRAAMLATGAFGLADDSQDASILITLEPGVYTAHITSAGGTGVVLAEVYDASTNPQDDVQRLVNISSRSFVSSGENLLIGGLIVTGNSPKRVLIRGVGPSLARFGLPQPLEDPRLVVYSGSAIIAENDDWGQGANSAASLTETSVRVGAFSLTSGSRDSALMITLNPGAYTVQLSGGDGAGTALVEIYEVP